jgi:hypothetical protein
MSKALAECQEKQGRLLTQTVEVYLVGDGDATRDELADEST